MSAAPPSPPIVTEAHCLAFVAAADALMRRRAGEIRQDDLDDFLALGWMAWHGGALRLTALGQMALSRMQTRLAQAA